MTTTSRDPFDDLPILAELRAEVAGGGARDARRDRHAMRRRRWWTARPRLSALLIALVLAGGSAGALAASGVFEGAPVLQRGVPVSPSSGVGVAVDSSVRLLGLRVADPGGGPPWGLRLVRTTRGLVCVQLGRVDFGTVGVLGQDGAFGNDGRFHPFTADYLSQGCGTQDADGNGFITVYDNQIPASGFAGGGPAVGGCAPAVAPIPTGLAPRVRAILRRLRADELAHHRPAPTCPARDLRGIYYGLLGPDAVRITYATANGTPAIQRTSGAQGAYLIVTTPTAYSCQVIAAAHGPGGVVCSNGSLGDGPRLYAGVVRSVTYRDG